MSKKKVREFPKGYQTVTEVVRDHLCHSCGVCGGICPQKAIDFNERALPLVSETSCNDCGLCLEVCSGWQGQAAAEMSGLQEREVLAVSTDKSLRRQSSSGGLVTEILRYLLQSGKIKKAYVTIADPENPTRPKAVIVSSEDGLLMSPGSRYCLYPWGKALPGLILEKEPFAVVGTSCQLSSLENVLQLFPRMRKNLLLKIGICCESNIEPAATDHLLKLRHLVADDIERIDYRDGPWPGVMAAVLKNRTVILSNKNRLEGAINYLKLTYGRQRCHFCSDILCESADLTVGDPWGRDKTGKLRYRGSEGYSAAIVRSTSAFDILRKMDKKKKIEMTEGNPGDFLSIQLAQRRAGEKRLAREMVTARKKNIPYPSFLKHTIFDASGRGLSFSEKCARRLFFLAHSPPFRSFLLKILFSPLGDLLT